MGKLDIKVKKMNEFSEDLGWGWDAWDVVIYYGWELIESIIIIHDDDVFKTRRCVRSGWVLS